MERRGVSLTFDEALDALGDVQRRELLLALLGPRLDDPPVVADGSGDGFEVVEDAIAMRHTHLPKLADHGLVEWDRADQTVHRGPAFGEIRPLLELLDDHTDELPEGWT